MHVCRKFRSRLTGSELSLTIVTSVLRRSIIVKLRKHRSNSTRRRFQLILECSQETLRHNDVMHRMIDDSGRLWCESRWGNFSVSYKVHFTTLVTFIIRLHKDEPTNQSFLAFNAFRVEKFLKGNFFCLSEIIGHLFATLFRGFILYSRMSIKRKI